MPLVWLGGVVVGRRTSDQQVASSTPGWRISGAALGKLFTHVPLSPCSINLVLAQAGKVTVGLASHWPCVTDNSGITTYGFTAIGNRDDLATEQITGNDRAYAPATVG